MTQFGGTRESDSRRASAEYHGADGDPRYPSTRKLRNAVANVADIVLPYGVLIAAFVGMMLLFGHEWILGMGDQTPVMLVSTLVVLVMVVADAIVLPAVVGATVGQFLTGLTWIRGTDGGKPTARDMGRATWRHRTVFRLGGVQQCAPVIVVVRRCDIAAKPPVGDAGYIEH
ncbi:hypothetical protein ACFXK0_25490 [Nocardia sp. NPDC059177]|uniref:hypothetical protein n=1 Tax=Nocardia sp. NPDC059177 TaxID=3346759 RepID=UPI0036A547B4